MRIGLIAPPWIPVPSPAYGGTEAVIDNLARGLAALGHEVRLFTVVMAEALGTATPVLAFPNGAAPEIIDHGRTGYLCQDEDEMIAALARVPEIDRSQCRLAAERRFSLTRMTFCLSGPVAWHAEHLIAVTAVVHRPAGRSTAVHAWPPGQPAMARPCVRSRRTRPASRSRTSRPQADASLVRHASSGQPDSNPR